jgi:hypothetical protein
VFCARLTSAVYRHRQFDDSSDRGSVMRCVVWEAISSAQEDESKKFCGVRRRIAAPRRRSTRSESSIERRASDPLVQRVAREARLTFLIGALPDL